MDKITITEDQALSYNMSIDELLQIKETQGYKVLNSYNHPAVGKVITLHHVEEEYAEFSSQAVERVSTPTSYVYNGAGNSEIDGNVRLYIQGLPTIELSYYQANQVIDGLVWILEQLGQRNRD